MKDLPFHSLEHNTLEITNTNSLSRFIDAIGFRYRWATEGLTDNEIFFRPIEGSMNMYEVLVHINEIVLWIDKYFGGEIDTENKPDSFKALRKSTLDHCLIISSRFKGMTDEELTSATLTNGKTINLKRYWNMLNGPISDILTHIGQITSWRRIAGNPQPSGVNLFRGTGIEES